MATCHDLMYPIITNEYGPIAFMDRYATGCHDLGSSCWDVMLNRNSLGLELLPQQNFTTEMLHCLVDEAVQWYGKQI